MVRMSVDDARLCSTSVVTSLSSWRLSVMNSFHASTAVAIYRSRHQREALSQTLPSMLKASISWVTTVLPSCTLCTDTRFKRWTGRLVWHCPNLLLSSASLSNFFKPQSVKCSPGVLLPGQVTIDQHPKDDTRLCLSQKSIFFLIGTMGMSITICQHAFRYIDGSWWALSTSTSHISGFGFMHISHLWSWYELSSHNCGLYQCRCFWSSFLHS